MSSILGRRSFAIAIGAMFGAALGLVVVRTLWFRGMPILGPRLQEARRDERGEGDEASEADATGRPRQARRPAVLPEVLPTLVPVQAWPREPASPEDVDPVRFAEAVGRLCGPSAPSRIRSDIAPAILESATRFGSDPFLLAAVMSRASRCGLKSDAVGLMGLDKSLYTPSIRHGEYHFAVREGGRWSEAAIRVDRFPLDDSSLARPEAEIYFAAAFLAAWERQHLGLDAAFSQARHRHSVSHFLYGDVVRSARQESWILIERRRILEYYGAAQPRPPVDYQGVRVGAPLDGAPRIAVSDLGESRGNGTRTHRGVDFESTLDEPVRAIADGTVVFAGIDLPGAAHQRTDMMGRRAIDVDEISNGGLYVCIEHRAEPNLLESCYMHLDRITVRQGRFVERGEQIGQVGNTGATSMGPHLHFEIHTQSGPVSAIDAMPGLVFGKRPPVRSR